MKQIDFEHGTVTSNILNAALPMLVAQIFNLLYNVVDRIYIARIPDVGTTALAQSAYVFRLLSSSPHSATFSEPAVRRFFQSQEEKVTARKPVRS